MNQEQIRILIEALAASELSELEYSEDGCTLRLVKQATSNSLTPLNPVVDGDSADAPGKANDRRDDHGGLPRADPSGDGSGASPIECLAPLYGVIHLQPAPGEPLFVKLGQSVLAGHTLCVIEAMKVFNEVRAETDATIAEVLVHSGQEVEAGQRLFRLA